MKSIKILLSAAFAMLAVATMAQQDFSNPAYARWGETPEQRQRNIEYSNFLKEQIQSKNYNNAAYYFQQLAQDRPSATVNIYKYGAIIYRNKIARAKSIAEQKVMVDSLLSVYDLRLEHFGNAAKEGAAFILDAKTRDVMKYKRNDMDAIRSCFNAALEAGGEATDPELVVAYFTKLCDVYQNSDVVMPEEVINEYDRLSPYIAAESAADLKKQFDNAFAQSGAANCENLEKMFSAKLAATPDDAALLKWAVQLMSRANCSSDFYFATAEKSYAV